MEPSPSLSEYLQEWLLIRRSRLQPQTIHGYQSTIRNYLEPQLGSVLLADLDVATLERTWALLLRAGGQMGRPLAAKTVRGVAAVLATALEHAVRQGLLTTNPCRHATLPRFDHRGREDGGRELQVWTAEEARRFLELARGHRLEEVWVVALGTGMRRGEVLGLRWEDVDVDRHTIHVRRSLSVVGGVARLKSPKSSRPRAIRVDDRVLAALEARRAEQDRDRRRLGAEWRNEWGLVFTTPGGRVLTPTSVTSAWGALVRRLGLPYIRLHDLRHTHATLMLQAGVPIKVVSERLGHASIQLTVDTYMHVLPAMDAEAVERFSALIEGDLDDVPSPGSVSGWQRVNVRLPDEIREKLEARAAERSMAVGDLIRAALTRGSRSRAPEHADLVTRGPGRGDGWDPGIDAASVHSPPGR